MQGMDLTSNSYTDKLDISVSGTTPTGGYLNYENSILKDGCLTMDEYKVTIENGEVTTTEKGSCESVSLTACDSPNFKPSPEEWFTFDASTNTITGFSDAWDGTTDIVIPCSIGGAAFANNDLSVVIIPKNVTSIGGNTFQKLRYGNNSELIDNPNLTTIYNNTGKSFDWGSIINGTSGYNFETGIVENEYGNVEVKKLN